jgi:hypothetical protein
MDPDDHSRFLIAPDRTADGVEQRYTIACGLLGGLPSMRNSAPTTSSSAGAIARSPQLDF